jgi:hypothetical protein
VARVAEASPPETSDVQISLNNEEDPDSTVRYAGRGAVETAAEGAGLLLSRASALSLSAHKSRGRGSRQPPPAPNALPPCLARRCSIFRAPTGRAC